MKVTRIYTGDDGLTHFEEQALPLPIVSEIGRRSKPEAATGIVFRENDETYNLDWHPAPARQYVVTIEGEVEVEAGDGTKKMFGPGDIMLAEDTSGQGHRSRYVSGNPRRSIFITLD
jgi:hypothetical protein